MRIVNYQEDHRAEWNAFVDSHPEGTFFHRAEWISVSEAYYGFASHSFLVKEGDEIEGVVPLLLCRSPLLGKCLLPPPICGRLNFCATPRARETIGEEIARLVETTGARFAELRFDAAHERGDLPTVREHVLQCLNLERSEEEQWKQLEPSVRNKVRQSEKHGFQIAAGRDLFPSFYRLYLMNMRQFAYPPLGRKLFRLLTAEFGDTMEILAVLREGALTASIINFYFKDTVTNLWGVSDREHRHLRPNNFLYWNALEKAIGTGYRVFDFGRARAGSGVFQFKKQWGASTIPLSYQYLGKGEVKLPSVTETQQKYRLPMLIWRRLPLKLTALLGPPLGKWAPL